MTESNQFEELLEFLKCHTQSSSEDSFIKGMAQIVLGPDPVTPVVLVNNSTKQEF